MYDILTTHILFPYVFLNSEKVTLLAESGDKVNNIERKLIWSCFSSWDVVDRHYIFFKYHSHPNVSLFQYATVLNHFNETNTRTMK